MGRTLGRLDERIRRSKRFGKIAFGGVVLMSLVFGGVLVQAWIVAEQTGHPELVFKALRALCCLVALNLFSYYLVRLQHRVLDEARNEMRELVEGDF